MLGLSADVCDGQEQCGIVTSLRITGDKVDPFFACFNDISHALDDSSLHAEAQRTFDHDLVTDLDHWVRCEILGVVILD